MTNAQLVDARNLISQKPYLIWSTKNTQNLSSQIILESILNYGDWTDFLEIIRIMGISEAAKLFKQLKDKKRSNLRKQTVHYFTNYFNQYA